jgi:hypothetical protein
MAEWQGCIRCADRKGRLIKDLKINRAPPLGRAGCSTWDRTRESAFFSLAGARSERAGHDADGDVH